MSNSGATALGIEIEKFNPEEYWSIKATFDKEDNNKFEAKLIHFNNEKIDKLTNKTTRATIQKKKKQQK